MSHRQVHENYDSLNNAQGEFMPHKPRDQPLQHGGHAPGTMVGNDAAPEFSAQVLPPGSAPADRTFQPNPISETPGQANNPLADRAHGKEATYTSASSTLTGADSADVHAGLGKPLAGQTSSDVDGKVSRSGGIIGTGATGAHAQQVDLNTSSRAGVLRGGDRDDIKPRDPEEPGVFSSKYAAASEREPESAETVAREARS